MRIGFIGLGKLGTSVALTVTGQGYEVFGYDPLVKSIEDFKCKELTLDGSDIKTLYNKDTLHFCTSMKEVVENCNLIFVTIQTPHEYQFEGSTRIPKERKDFDYSFLINGIKELNAIIEENNVDKVVTIISTVLPGTIRESIIPCIGQRLKLAYSPQFVGMTQVYSDFLYPEFVLLGTCDPEGTKTLRNFYEEFYSKGSLTIPPILEMKLESAELAKVAYNCFIGQKIVFANTVMEICEKTDADCDEVMSAIKHAHRRLISTSYLTCGLGDGGPCHNRDNIAMSWLAEELELSHNIFEDIMAARENQTEYLANYIRKLYFYYEDYDLVLLGKAFKPNTNLIIGSPAILLANLLKEKNELSSIQVPFQHYENLNDYKPKSNDIIFLATKHPEFENYEFPKGCVVVDPFGYYKPTNNDVYKIGRK